MYCRHSVADPDHDLAECGGSVSYSVVDPDYSVVDLDYSVVDPDYSVVDPDYSVHPDPHQHEKWDPDPHQNVLDPPHWSNQLFFIAKLFWTVVIFSIAYSN